jgi:hypothetical protein
MNSACVIFGYRTFFVGSGKEAQSLWFIEMLSVVASITLINFLTFHDLWET